MIKKEDLYYPTQGFQKKAWIKDKKIYQEAAKDPIKFWERKAQELFWFKKWHKAFSHKPPYFQWFVGGKLNITENIFKKLKDKPALIWEPEPINEKSRVLSYQELFREVNRFANVLKKLGVKKGDRVGIYLPMIPEVVIAMLACARIGAVHSVVFSAFSSAALKVRLQDTEAKVLITADGYYRGGKLIALKQQADKGVKETKIEKVIVVKRAGHEVAWDTQKDCWWHELVKQESDQCQPEVMDAEDPLFILYTSGSSGKPKGIVHTCGGYTVQAHWTGKWIFDLKDEDTMWCVPPNTRVITNPDVKQISEIQLGDRIFTHKGYFERIEGVFSRFYEGEMIKFNTLYSNQPVLLTPKHKVIVLKKRMPVQWAWIEAKNVKEGDYLAFPRITKSRLKKEVDISEILPERKKDENYIYPLKGDIGKVERKVKVSKELLRLIGYYIAEGSIARDTIQITFAQDEEKLVDDCASLLQQVFRVKTRKFLYHGGLEVRVDSTILAQLFEKLFGRPSFNKHLPNWVLLLPWDYLKEFIKGYFAGDGSTSKNRRRIRFTTTSLTLSQQLKIILNKLGVVVGIQHLPAAKIRKRQIQKKIQSRHDCYELSITGHTIKKLYSILELKDPINSYSWQKAIVTTRFIFFPVTKKRTTNYQGLVWNLKTRSNSYVANNITAHNCTADIGWITSHTYGCYSLLLNGITFVMFEGLPVFPTPDRWAQIIEKHKVTIFYTAPTAIRMFEKYGAKLLEKYPFAQLRLLGSVGEPIDESAWSWYFKNVGKARCPIVDTWWQTETGGILITSLPGLGPFRPAFTGLPFPGVKIDILDKKGKSLPPDQEGSLVVLPPFSPGLLRGVYKDPEKYLTTYWSQYGKKTYFTSDGALKDKNGLIRVVGRIDDTIKVAGHRLTTGELEAAINLHPEITECAVVGMPDEIKGEVPVAFIVFKDGKSEEQIKKEVMAQIQEEIGPIALPKEIYLVEDLPKTRSGKIMRRILRKLFTGEELGDLSTLANQKSVQDIKAIIHQ